jgi:hypothetical protein
MWKPISIPVPKLSDHYLTYSPDQGQRIISPGSASKRFPSSVTHWDFLQAAPNSEIKESPATGRQQINDKIALKLEYILVRLQHNTGTEWKYECVQAANECLALLHH